MKVELGKTGLKTTFQDDFPEETKCVKCGHISRIAFVAHETDEKSIIKGGQYVCELHEGSKGNLWPHDACCVAVYFCKECLQPTALYNQA